MEIELKYAVKDEEVIKKILHDPYLESIKDNLKCMQYISILKIEGFSGKESLFALEKKEAS